MIISVYIKPLTNHVLGTRGRFPKQKNSLKNEKQLQKCVQIKRNKILSSFRRHQVFWPVRRVRLNVIATKSTPNNPITYQTGPGVTRSMLSLPGTPWCHLENAKREKKEKKRKNVAMETIFGKI